MNSYNRQLEALAYQMQEKKRLESEIKVLEARIAEFSKSLYTYDYERKKCLEELETLESGGIRTFFARISGRLDERIKNKKQESEAAYARYESAAKELSELHAKLEQLKANLQPIRSCETDYYHILQKKKESLKASGSESAQRLNSLESETIALQRKKVEISEAISTGKAALSSAESVLKSLGSANNMATWDMIGGGMVSDLLKHRNLDRAQHLTRQLKHHLDSFKAELSDVSFDAEIRVSIDGFIRFADYFFDGILVDWAVKDRIHRSISEIRQIQSSIKSTLTYLTNMQISADGRLQEIRKEIESLVLGA